MSVRSRYAAPEEVISQLCMPKHLTIFSSSSTDELLANVSCSGYYSRATVDRVEVVREVVTRCIASNELLLPNITQASSSSDAPRRARSMDEM